VNGIAGHQGNKTKVGKAQSIITLIMHGLKILNKGFRQCKAFDEMKTSEP
jgi:hypothetical protein